MCRQQVLSTRSAVSPNIATRVSEPVQIVGFDLFEATWSCNKSIAANINTALPRTTVQFRVPKVKLVAASHRPFQPSQVSFLFCHRRTRTHRDRLLLSTCFGGGLPLSMQTGTLNTC